jgi:hypothetical protein
MALLRPLFVHTILESILEYPANSNTDLTVEPAFKPVHEDAGISFITEDLYLV